MRTPALAAASLLAVASAAGVALLSCSGGPPQSPAEVAVRRVAAVPADPDDAAWRTAPMHVAPLVLQDLVEPRLLVASTTEVRVQALTDGARVAFRLDWSDASRDDLPGAARFGDACAVQLPDRLAPDVPAPQMGEPGRAVEITHWRAFWQATVDGRADTIQELYPNATVDHYPFDAPSLPPGSTARREMADRFAPARALGNRMAGPRARPVEDLIAEGPGTIRPAAATSSDGRGRYRGNGWSVVLTRPLPESLAGAGRSQVAFAVWEGANAEAGSRKMRTGWIPIGVEGGR